MRCAAEVLRDLPARSLEYHDVHAAAHMAAAYAACGQRREALDTLSQIDRQFVRTTLPWIDIAWRLMKADVLLMLGSAEAAGECVRDVVKADTSVQLLPHFEGKIAAWTAALAKSHTELAQAAVRIGALMARLKELDLIDQVEVLAASVLVAASMNQELGELPMRLERSLAQLPRPCAELLVQLRLTPELRSLLARPALPSGD
jgi:hypothetical protein